MKKGLKDHNYVTPYTADEAKTMRRCQKGELVSADDLLMISTDMLRMQEQVNNIFNLAASHNLSQEFWDDLNELYIQLPGVSPYCLRWRAKKTGEPERQAVEWRPSRLPDNSDA
jgi:hypothetical protein